MVEGGSVTLTCSSDADPPVLTYRWFNQGSDVELGTGQNYTITNISSQHSGPYYCTAQNQLGQNRSGPSRLHVLCEFSVSCMVLVYSECSVTGLCLVQTLPELHLYLRLSLTDQSRWSVSVTPTLPAPTPGSGRLEGTSGRLEKEPV